MPLGIMENFPKYEKTISKYVRERVLNTYFPSRCFTSLKTRVNKMQACWDLIPGTGGSSQGQRFLSETYYPLVKEQIKMNRAIASNAFRFEPMYMFSASGNTPMENAINMTELVESNNKHREVLFRQKVLLPSINYTARFGSSVVYTEYQESGKNGYKTSVDPLIGVQRQYGQLEKSQLAIPHIIDPRHYFQNPNVVDPNDSDFNGFIKRIPLSKLISYVKNNPELFIKENIKKVFDKLKKGSVKENEYVDPQGRITANDFNKIITQDLIIGQFQLLFDGNEDDDMRYTIWIIGEDIIRFQDNPYDENMNQFDVITMEPRLDTWHGNTPAEDSVGNENAINLINGVGLENLLASLNRYIFYNKNAFQDNFGSKPLNFLNPVNVSPNIALNSLMYTYQVPDISGNLNEMMYSRILQNNQRTAASADLVNKANAGGMSNQTATAANMAQNQGDIKNADNIEVMSYRYASVGEKISFILKQFMANDGPVSTKPKVNQPAKTLQKTDILGNFYVETNVQKTYYGEMTRYQNVITWLANLMPAIPQLQQANIASLVRQVLRMSQTLKVDDVLPEQIEQIPGYVQSQVQPGQEMAGAAQQVNPQQQQMAPEMAGMMQ